MSWRDTPRLEKGYVFGIKVMEKKQVLTEISRTESHDIENWKPRERVMVGNLAVDFFEVVSEAGEVVKLVKK